MFAALLLAFTLNQPAASTSSLSDGPLKISANHLATSIRVANRSQKKLWTCDAAGAGKVQFGDIRATADRISVSQIDSSRYQFSLRGSANLSIRTLSAKADRISWSMDNRPMVFSGNATITIHVGGKATTLSSEKITFHHSENKLTLADGTTKTLPASKVNALTD